MMGRGSGLGLSWRLAGGVRERERGRRKNMLFGRPGGIWSLF